MSPSAGAVDASKEAKIHSLRSFEDLTGRLEAREALAPARLRQMQPMHGFVYPTAPQGVTWVEVDLQKPQGGEAVLKIMSTSLKSMSLYEKGESGNLRVVKSGAAREGFHRYYYVDVPIKTQRAKVYLRLTTAHVMTNMPIEVMAKQDVAEDIESDALSNGIYFGSMVLMVLFSMLLYAMLRDPIYIYFGSFIAVYSLLRVSMDGLLEQMFATDLFGWKSYCVTLYADLAALTTVLYSRYFLELKKRQPLLNKVTDILAAFYLFCTLTGPFMYHATAVKVTYLVHGLAVPYLLFVGIASIQRGFTPARYFLAGLSGLLFSNVYILLFNTGILSTSITRSWNMDFAMRAGSIIEMTFFAFALADRLQHFEVGRKKAQNDLRVADLKRRVAEKKAQSESNKSLQYVAIAQMTQALAHDVRKPFSILNMGLDRLGAIGDDPVHTRALAKRIKEHVGRAFADVNDMISDIMEISSKTAPLANQELPLRALVRDSLYHVFKHQETSEIRFDYSFAHERKAYVDVIRCARIFANIIETLRQRMGNKGVIWVYSKDVVGDMIEVTVGCSNVHVSDDERAKVFELFAPKTRAGTGLAMLVSKKIVEHHGGTILCKSNKEVGTEFIFTLPGAKARDHSVDLMPRSAKEISDEFVQNLRLTLSEAPAPAPVYAEAAAPNKHKVAVVDDDAFILDMWERKLDPECVVFCFDTPAAFLARVITEPAFLSTLSLVIVDYYFDGSPVTGVQLGTTIKESKARVPILLSSDVELKPHEYNSSVDGRIAKEPLSFAELEKYVKRPGEKRLLLVDDDRLYLDLLLDQIAILSTNERPYACRVAQSATEAIALCRLDVFDLILCDIHLGQGEMTGMDALFELRELALQARIMVHSNYATEADQRILLERGADAFIGKPSSGEELQVVLETAWAMGDKGDENDERGSA